MSRVHRVIRGAYRGVVSGHVVPLVFVDSKRTLIETLKPPAVLDLLEDNVEHLVDHHTLEW